MMQHEFEERAGITVTAEDYNNIIEPMYMALKLSKDDFVKVVNLKFFKDRVPRKPKDMRRMLVRNKMFDRRTPNGCYYYIQWVELVAVDIKTGKYIVKPLDDKDLAKLRQEGHSLDLSYGYDMDYTRCMDTKRKPIKLTWDC